MASQMHWPTSTFFVDVIRRDVSASVGVNDDVGGGVLSSLQIRDL